MENSQITDKEKDFDFSSIISPEILPKIPNYDYGRSQEPLDYNRLRNKPNWWWQYYCGLIQRSSWATWSQSITWVGFKPKYITYTLMYRNWSSLMSTWFANSITNTSYINMDLVAWNWYGIIWTWANPVMAFIRTAWGQYIEPHLTSFDSDWFTIDWVYISQNADIIYTCFW